LSFHATKLFHTVEGGAVVLHDAEVDKRLRLLRSFGHVYDEHFTLGMNAKMSELHASMGMAVLPHMERIIAERAAIVARYEQQLADLGLERPVVPPGTTYNYAYHPILLRDRAEREGLLEALAAHGIHARRYFFPSLDTLPYVSSPACLHSHDLADRALCLPLYNGLDAADQDRICAGVKAYLIANRARVPSSAPRA
jgi:dTDP-4-amino-4,6-dideoxygalactose transaminase